MADSGHRTSKSWDQESDQPDADIPGQAPKHTQVTRISSLIHFWRVFFKLHHYCHYKLNAEKFFFTGLCGRTGFSVCDRDKFI